MPNQLGRRGRKSSSIELAARIARPEPALLKSSGGYLTASDDAELLTIRLLESLARSLLCSSPVAAT